MEQFENNKLKIIYNHHRKFGNDIVNIDIENTSFGAMGLFQKDLHELAEKWKLKSKFKKLNTGLVPGGTQMGGGLINMHLLYIPTFLSIQILPTEDKKEIREIFLEFKDWLHICDKQNF